MSLTQEERAALHTGIVTLDVAKPGELRDALLSLCTPGMGSPDGLTITNDTEDGFDGEIISRSRFRVRKLPRGGVQIEIKP